MLDHIVNIPVDDEISLLDQTPPVEEATTDEETIGQDRPGLQKNKSVTQIFDEMFEGLDISCIKSTTIFKVQMALRESNPDAYIPKMISIGPYHKENPELRSMEKYKLLYLQRFLKRKEGINVESCIKELEKLKDKALKCYDDVEDNTGQFLQMLLLDGCFVVEFFRDCFLQEDLIFNGPYMYYQLLRDFLLLENQLPFFVLTMLHQMTMEEDEVSLLKLVKQVLKFLLSKWIQEYSPETEDNEKNINHLLQIVHYMSCQPLERETNVPIPQRKIDDKPSCYEMMPNATELSEAGVRFSKVGNIRTGLLEIKFTNGWMEIPCLVVYDYTETILRNLIAYEQQSSGIELQYFSDFVAFMDTLIDSEKDVALLRERGIIRDMIGEDKKVADIFNKIGNGVVTSPDNFYYKEECRKAIQHCGKTWNRRKANFRHNYSKSWAVVSTVVTFTLLFLALLQTELTFISVVK